MLSRVTHVRQTRYSSSLSDAGELGPGTIATRALLSVVQGACSAKKTGTADDPVQDPQPLTLPPSHTLIVRIMSLFRQLQFITSAHRMDQLPDTGFEIAFAGRSNAGKSSAINTLAGRNRVAFVSKTPGRTPLINFFRFADDAYLVDLPGYGYADVPLAVRDHWGRLLERYLQSRASLAGLVVIMDARHPLKDLDRQLIDWFTPTGRPMHVLLTKADKLSNMERIQTLRRMQDTLGGVPQCSMQLFSSLKKTGIEEMEGVVRSWLSARVLSPENNAPVADASRQTPD